MKTNTGIILKTSLALFIANFIIGLMLKITNSGKYELLIITGAVVLLVFIITALYEIFTTRFINRSQKITLTIGFILLSGIMPFLYLFLIRKNVVAV